ncbi:MAG TPA: Crp/Fnr family transcriptional regulator [Bacteroidales bacterium]|nr:Crp/Fnr family transcriptional regulator [Bacteroidales bacterium]HRX96010.1 Crp/Fnr family transcriptional regulator [Bacteroidales bacterium]
MAEFKKETHCSCCNLKLNIFRFLTDSELAQINKNRFEVHFNKGETIFKQGGPFTHVACITQGMAKVYLEGHKGKNVILKILRPTELVGGPGFPVDYRHHFSVQAITEARACFIDIHDFEEMMNTNRQFSMEFVRHLNKATIHIYDKIQNLTQKQMHGRIAETLLYLCNNVYKNGNFDTTLTRQDIADLSAMTKESAIRILKEFKDDGIIDYNSHTFNLLKPDQLEVISKTG